MTRVTSALHTSHGYRISSWAGENLFWLQTLMPWTQTYGAITANFDAMTANIETMTSNFNVTATNFDDMTANMETKFGKSEASWSKNPHSVWKREREREMNAHGFSSVEKEYIRKHHRHYPAENQCSSTLVKHIKAPVHLVWSLVRRFDQPQKYKPFISRCVVKGNLEIGSLREVDVKSGLPATTSTERLELLDEEEHILSIRIVGGDHRLRNYSSILSVHPEVIDGRPGTLVIESFVVDVPDGNTKDETCYFVEALIKCNLKSLADVSERLAVQDRTEPIDRM
ncbi:hypothetical protein RHMOL_Rhmol09G0265500 [Rhododendron molle]|uniref:Uncharacterized protein n=1 Tax=Rhododendron molle TaxID=49168 RepID=A0ACC0MHD6_RHOML|nr:hypothetical protein RHMOL_Rhmol09G0265500 [Rhododendron molle]